jgi:succinate-semialdehyde dehydrogenase/glutarate-semialdehyde dehydrogenase
LLENDQAAQVIADPRISAITLTGSTRAGSAVAQQAGSLLKKTVLELGGSDPFLVLPSADLDAAVAAAVKSRTLNNGQSCIAAKRFIIHEDVYEAFEPRFVAAMRALKVGDPMNAATDIGPLVSAAARDNLARQVEEAITAGARILTGAHALPGKGFFFEPTVLADLPTTAPVYREEFFGPVALLFRASSLDAAIALANNTSYGLGATVFTRNIEEQEHCIAEIEAGQVFINEIVASDPRLPFGGVKQSGYGRELATEGIREFTTIKTVRWA